MGDQIGLLTVVFDEESFKAMASTTSLRQDWFENEPTG
jgi:hypothetical protein